MPSTALIAGFGPGFVEELAWKLAEADYRVVLLARSGEYLEARELGRYGVHVVHAAVDGLILNPDMREIAPRPIEAERYMDPESVAEVCLSVIEQDAGCWTSSIDLRAPVGDLQHLLDELLD